jgi:hypothetical protein
MLSCRPLVQTRRLEPVAVQQVLYNMKKQHMLVCSMTTNNVLRHKFTPTVAIYFTKCMQVSTGLLSPQSSVELKGLHCT